MNDVEKLPGDEPEAPEPEVLPAEPAGEGTVIPGELVHMQREVVRSAPFPPPKELEEYERILPGFTERTLTLTERETEHRHDIERKQVDGPIGLARRGQSLAFTILLVLAGGGVAGTLTGHSVEGLAAIATAAAGIIVAFVAPRAYARRHRAPDGDVPTGQQ
ncbi:MAG TPA: DUF2335 domain-containing protein [Solirubrobacteraceae bacterium]|nr:DUF2335 domain-containing protein [Solirubrobacteraceae bacterium]